LLLDQQRRIRKRRGDGTRFEPQEHAAYESARSCRLPSLASYFILRFAVGHAP